MTPDEFRRHGRAMIDWIANYLETAEERPVGPQVKPGEIRAQLPASPPEQAEPFEAILADLDRVILPGITHWQSPNFFGYFPSNNSYPSILGDLASAGLGVQGMLWATSPACTELETHLMDWLVEMMGLPPHFASSAKGGGVIQDSASSAVLCAILAARERATEGRANLDGPDGRLAAYVSTQTHSSVEKDIRVSGIGSRRLRAIEVDDAFAMRPEKLAEAIAADRAAGLQPFFVCATLGTTSSTAFDPLPEIGRICRQEGLWLHVDAALAGTAGVCPEFRPLLAGLELADSYCFNPHKWMFTNFDCSAFFLADRAALIRALSILPDYLRNQATESGSVIDYRDWQVPLGRRFRALKLWFVIRSFGVEGIRQRIRAHVALAQELADWVDGHPQLERTAPTPLNLVCFRHRGGDGPTQQLIDRLNGSGRLLVTQTRLRGQLTVRFSIGQTRTERRHLLAAWQQIVSAVEAIG